MNQCVIEDCPKPVHARRLCSSHYEQHKRAGTLDLFPRASNATIQPCNAAGCPFMSHAYGYCHTHYDRWRKGQDIDAPVRQKRPSSAVLERDDLGRKQCIGCRAWLPEADFGNVRLGDGLNVKCRKCVALHARARRYGLSVDDLRAMYATQAGLCGSCGDALGEDYAVDHDHACCPYAKNQKTCGQCTRSLLCGACNFVLGHAYDSVDRLLKAAHYLEKWSAIAQERAACSV